MGYQRPLLKLVFQDPEFDGLEVVCRRLRVGELAAMASLAQAGEDITKAENTDKLNLALERLAAHIVGWNLEDEDGNPVPTTVDGLNAQDFGLVLALLKAWMDAAVGVAPPLPQPSIGGAPSLEASIPMEPLSPALAS